MLLGSEFIIAYLLGFLMASSFIVFHAYISGNALYNSKILIESFSFISLFYLKYLDSKKIPKEGSIYASGVIGELYSLSFKDSSPTLIIFFCFNLAFVLLGGHYFDNSGYISAAVGLR